jgi:RES domain-containing protein
MCQEPFLADVSNDLSYDSLSAHTNPSDIFYRAVKSKYLRDWTSDPEHRGPLSAIGAYTYGGRYNQSEKFQVLYVADSKLTTELECKIKYKYKDREFPNLIMISSSDADTYEICEIISYKLQYVFDLTIISNQSALGTNYQELTGCWNWPDPDAYPVAPTQNIGYLVFNSNSVTALKVPSAQNLGAFNLAIFPARLREHDSFLVARDPLGNVGRIGGKGRMPNFPA